MYFCYFSFSIQFFHLRFHGKTQRYEYDAWENGKSTIQTKVQTIENKTDEQNKKKNQTEKISYWNLIIFLFLYSFNAFSLSPRVFLSL